MSTPETQERISKMIADEAVVLFMKGTRNMPQCGFSAATVQVLDELIEEYATVDVLADPAIRDGIKVFSDWPTIPQLYIQGEFIGGADIVREMNESGDLQTKLGVETVEVEAPEITVSDGARDALNEAKAEGVSETAVLRLSVDARFAHALDFDEPRSNDIVTESNGMKVHMNAGTARKARGLTLDYVEGPGGTGFRIDNPNAPPTVKELAPEDLKEKMNAGDKLALYDVRTPDELKIAKIEGSKLLDEAAQDEIMALAKDTPLYFYCHTGTRSRAAAQHFIGLGFKTVFNISGGIDAWAIAVDQSVRRY